MQVPLCSIALKMHRAFAIDPARGQRKKSGRKLKMFIVQCNVAATARERPIAPPSAWRIPPVEDTIESVAEDLLEGQYNNPVRVIGFDSAERTSCDVSEDVVRVLRQHCVEQRQEPPEFLQDFLGRYKSAR